jgi:membrane-bound lytic murein transglycosylase MltF
MHLEDRYTEDLPALRERRYIRVLITVNRTNFFLDGARAFGFEHSLLREYETYLNRRVSRRDLRVVLEFIPVARDELIQGLVEGRGDIAAAGLTITSERLKLVDFTTPYIRGVDEVVVAHEDVDTEDLLSLDDLSGRRVFVRRSSSYHESLLGLNERLAQAGLRSVKILEADETLETEDILEMVNSGAVKLTVADSHLAEAWASVLPDIRILPHLKLREGGDIAWAIPKETPELRKSLGGFIRSHRQGTLKGNIYFSRYFEDNRWLRNPLEAEARRREAQYENLFRKYARKYGFDWKLIMAVAYQESRLDQKKRSPAGAVGLMQMRPATARDKNVGIVDIHLPENNVHAGVKYLAFLRDHYFDDEGLREQDRIRFALAAYNAGPAKVRKARALAARIGLDPDRWFRNVEVAALRIVGQETVRYVSNINKYYVLLNLADRKT